MIETDQLGNDKPASDLAHIWHIRKDLFMVDSALNCPPA